MPLSIAHAKEEAAHVIQYCTSFLLWELGNSKALTQLLQGHQEVVS